MFMFVATGGSFRSSGDRIFVLVFCSMQCPALFCSSENGDSAEFRCASEEREKLLQLFFRPPLRESGCESEASWRPLAIVRTSAARENRAREIRTIRLLPWLRSLVRLRPLRRSRRRTTRSKDPLSRSARGHRLICLA